MKKLFFVLIIGLLALIAYLKKNNNSLVSKVKLLESNSMKISQLTNENFLRTYIYKDEGKSLPINLKNQIVSKQQSKPILFIRYSELNCSTCVDSIFSIIKNKNLNKNLNIIVLAYYVNDIYLEQFKRLNRITYPIININKESLGLISDELNLPYLFMTDSSFRVKHLYFPVKEDAESTNTYFNIISERYYN